MMLGTVRPPATDQLHASREDYLRARAAGGDETSDGRADARTPGEPDPVADDVARKAVILVTFGVCGWRHAWAARFRRLARHYAQLAEPLAGWHCVACAILMLKRVMALLV
jgi:hypothetical protein